MLLLKIGRYLIMLLYILLLATTLLFYSPQASAQESAAKLDFAAASLQAITVTATRTRRKVNEVPESVSIIDTEQLRTRQAADLGDIFRYLPNVDLGGGRAIWARM